MFAVTWHFVANNSRCVRKPDTAVRTIGYIVATTVCVSIFKIFKEASHDGYCKGKYML